MKRHKRKYSFQEIERRRQDKFDEMREQGYTMSEEEWNNLMNYYDDKKPLDQRRTNKR